MQQKFFKGTGKLVAGLAVILLTASVYSCNDDKKSEATTTDTTKVSTDNTMMKTPDTTKMHAMKDSTVIDTIRTDQAPPPPRH